MAKAFFVSLIAFVAMNAVAWLVLLTEGRSLLTTLFETTSAFGTVGLSMGENGAPVSLSAFFTPAGKLLIMAMMFIGRIGPLTLAIAVARRGCRAGEDPVSGRQDSRRIDTNGQTNVRGDRPRALSAPGLVRVAFCERETGAAVLEVDAEVSRGEACAEAVEDRIDQRDGHAVAVDHGDIDGVACGSPRSGGRRPASRGRVDQRGEA